MPTFATIEEWIAYLEGPLPAAVLAAGLPAVKRGTELVQTSAKNMLGHYQAGAGEFPDWEQLHAITIGEREAWGYPGDAPELVTDELRNHIDRSEAEVTPGVFAGAVGVPNEWVGEHDDALGDPHTRFRNIGAVAEAQELGLHGMPQRSFLGLSCAKHHDEIVTAMGEGVAAALAGAPAPPSNDDIPF